MIFNINSLFDATDYLVEIYEGNTLIQRQRMSVPE